MLAGVGTYQLLSSVTRLVQTPARAGYGFSGSVLVAGLVLLPFSLASVAGSRAVTALARRLSARAALPLGCGTLACAALGLALAHDSLWQLLVVMAVAGLGVGATSAAVAGLVLRCVPASETGSALGFNHVLRMAGFSAGSALSASLLELHTPSGASLPTESGYVAAGLVGAGVCLVACLVNALLLRGTDVLSAPRPPTAAPAPALSA